MLFVPILSTVKDPLELIFFTRLPPTTERDSYSGLH